VATTTHSDNSYTASITGEASLTAADIIVPSDPSSAAFPVVAALITRNSTVTVTGVSINPYRFGLYQTLIDMGGDITISNERVEGGEPVADLICRSSQLKAITVPASRAASMIDEYPVLAVAAAFAEGVTHMPGIEELRVKETDRIALMEDSLQRGGVDITSTHDSMTVTGAPEQQGGMTIDAQHDHRIAMSCLVFGLASREPVTVTGCETINTSFPGFDHLMQSLGADIRADQIDADKKNHKGNT
jgi:3-phosphoshikimate 1-carboxyvinyltransferase